MSAPLLIYIFFDYTCPWCYVTELGLERLAKEYPLTIVLKAYPLWANGMTHLTPEENELLRLQTHAADAQAVTAAREWLGVEGMSLGAWGVNTLDAHVGAKFAAERGRLKEYQHAMFAAQFHRDLRLDSRETLSLLASEAGLPTDDFLSALDVDEYRRAVSTDLAQAVQVGITGVPALIIGNRYLIVGARSPEALREIIEKSNQLQDAG